MSKLDKHLSVNSYLYFKDKYGFFLKGELSQWFKSPFIYNSRKFCCCEQFMMYCKAMLFKDLDIADQILRETKPSIHKSLGRVVKNFDPQIWDKHKYQIVYVGNYNKFTQNEDLKQLLLYTDPYILVEANGHDRIWGIGKFVDDNKLMDVETWGENLLGQILTQVREQIKKDIQLNG